MIFKVIAPQPYGVVLPIVLGYERINDMEEVNRIDPSLYSFATQKHKKEFEQQAERIKELYAGVLKVVADSNQAQIEASKRIRELEAENRRLREDFLRIDHYFRVNDIDIEQVLKG